MTRQTTPFALVLTALLLTGCNDGSVGEPPRDRDDVFFTEIAQEAGLDFVHFNGMGGELYLFEMMGPGAALFDYDNDGDLDVFIVQGAVLGPDAPTDAAQGRLFRNDLTRAADGSQQLRFVDVTASSGIAPGAYGMGVAAGDYDNDGWTDLYLTAFGENRLLRNNGNGTFSDRTEAARVGEARWSVSAAFVDFDRDGHLDLYVGNYLDLTFANNKECFFTRRDYCNPKSYGPVPDRLFRNRGDGSFEDVTAVSQIAGEYGGALGVISADFNLDGWPDLYVANDGLPNQCWINRRDGTFRNVALLAGCALNDRGEAEASMGLDAGDFDNDGDEDLFMSHISTETNTLYINLGDGDFEDGSIRTGVAGPSTAFTGFGAGWFDYDNDGWLDLFVANGAVRLIESLVLEGDPFPLHQPNQLFRNDGTGKFVDLSSRGGEGFVVSEVSRGTAFGDIDNDGDTDILVLNNNGPARLLRNEVGNRLHWLGLRMLGGDPPREMLGAWVTVTTKDGESLRRRVRNAASYACANDSRLLFGLGAQEGPVDVEAEWPDGRKETWSLSEIDRWVDLEQGSGKE